MNEEEKAPEQKPKKDWGFHRAEARVLASRHHPTTARAEQFRHFGAKVTDLSSEDDVTFICGYCRELWPCQTRAAYEQYELEKELLQLMYRDMPAKEVTYESEEEK